MNDVFEQQRKKVVGHLDFLIKSNRGDDRTVDQLKKEKRIYYNRFARPLRSVNGLVVLGHYIDRISKKAIITKYEVRDHDVVVHYQSKRFDSQGQIRLVNAASFYEGFPLDSLEEFMVEKVGIGNN